jgi:3-oxoacyl-[acyl-carrier-protein] synthase-3
MFFNFKNLKISGIAVGVPKNIVKSEDLNLSADYDAAAFIETTGIRERRYSNDFTTSDLCYAAAEKLIADLGWEKSDIDILIFVSQNADYILPATACILQDRLGLKKECYAEDIALGCSGWVYGLSTIAGLMSGGDAKKALLLAGDAKRRAEYELDTLMGFSGTATAIEYEVGAEGFKFHIGTDGSGYQSIIIPDGGARNMTTEKSFIKEDVNGNMINRLTPRMDGMDVFSFAITVPPKSIKLLAEKYGFDYHEADYFVFHQGNVIMLNKIIKKLKVDPEKMPLSLPYFGNTSSASIPITIATQLKGKIEHKHTKFIGCGFGVGLSWGTVAFETENIVISDLVEL